MPWVLPLLGFLLVATAMQDLFHTLFHPTEQGNVSEYLTLACWRLARRHFPSRLRMVGPANFVVVITYWGVSVVVGFALIYRPFLMTSFVAAPGIDLAHFQSLMGAVVLSLASLITVGIGLQSNSISMQLAMGIEAVIGFAILTASISWILAIYPVIEHRRSFSYEVSLLHFTETTGRSRLDRLDESELQAIMLGLAEQIATIQVELSQFPITYYFQEKNPRSALAPALMFVAELARDISESNHGPKVSATVLGGSVDDLVDLVAEKYLRRKYNDRWSALHAFIQDHDRQALHRPCLEA